MRRGCISLGEVKCDICTQPIPYPDRYLVVEELDGAEVDSGGSAVRYCIKCAIDKGYARYHEEKGERVLTFLP